MEGEVLVMMGAFVTAIVFAIGIPVAKAYSRRMDADSKGPRIPAEVTQRLGRLEQAVDAIAVEVERISEGQRFTTRILSEGTPHNEASRISSGNPAQDRGAERKV